MRISPRWLVCLVILSASIPASATPDCWPNGSDTCWPNAAVTRANGGLANPQNWPNDPGYGFEYQTTCPGGGPLVWEPMNGYWELWGFYPPDTPDVCGIGAEPYTLSESLSSSERSSMSGTGMSADLAWTLTTGDPHVLIAIHDSGAEWGNDDLANKWYLNKGELTVPQLANGTPCDDYDCNGDGVFNVLDYTSYVPGVTPDDKPYWNTVVDPRLLEPRCGDVNNNGILDPEDLINCFSNGVDEDGDGFTDDISGWDFFRNTNDPVDDENYGHGNDEAKWSSSEGNNGRGSIGVCPDCRVMMVRVGDSFVADSDHFAEGVYFSLANGANVISQALGTIDNTPFMQDTIDAAYNANAIIVSSAADEDSLHHNYPGNAEHTLLVHAIQNDADIEDATSFVRFNNCSNGGGHLVLSTPAGSCSSEATGLSAGEAGLLYSAMLKYQPSAAPLTAAEAMQLMWMSSEDINVPGSATNPALYPSGPGWDTYFGYGRNDAGAAVTAISKGQIPPEIDVTSPRWFQTVDPTQTPKLTISGTIAAKRAASYDFKVQVAAGLNPPDSAFQQVASVTGSTMPTSGTLATADISALYSNPAAASDDPNAFAATVVVQAVAHYGGSIGDVPGLFRKSIFIHRDPDLFKGFPIYLGASGESSPHMIDLDGSGHDTLVLATADGKVHAIRADGTELSGWPVQVQTLADIQAEPNVSSYRNTAENQKAQAIDATVAIGSLKGDGKLQVVASTLDGQLYAWNADGSVVAGFPVHADPSHFILGDTTENSVENQYILGKGFFASPSLYDLDGNGQLEIIEPGEDGWLYVWDASGQPYPGFPVEIYDRNGGEVDLISGGTGHAILHSRLMTTPAVGKIASDGSVAIVLGSNENYGFQVRAYAVWHDGNNHAGGPFLPGWPVVLSSPGDASLPDAATGESNAAAIANFKDHSGNLTPVVAVSAVSSPPIFFNGAGQQLGSASIETTGAKATQTSTPYAVAVNSGAFGDVDGDGFLDYVDGTIGASYILSGGIGGSVRETPSHSVSAWGAETAFNGQGGGFTANPLPGFPAAAQDFQFFMNYAIADIDGDGKNEILSGTGVYLVTAFRADGSQPTNWPKNTGGWVIPTPTVGDIDGDGYIDVADMTREGWLWLWHGKGLANQKIQWQGYAHDPQNTGNFDTALEVRAGPTAKSGCHCGSGGPETVLELLSALALFARRSFRRRRSG